jgi:hypothetical protein
MPSGADQGPERATGAAEAGSSGAATAPAALGPTLALTVALGAAAFGIVAALVVLLVAPQPIEGLPGAAQRQDAETALYVLAFVVLLPAALIVVPQRADAIAARVGDDGLSLLAASLVGGLCVAILVTRVLPGDGAAGALAALAIWGVSAGAALWRAARAPAWGALDRSPRTICVAWALAAALALVGVLAFTALDSIGVPVLIAGVLVCVAVTLAYRSGVVERLPRPSRPWLLAVDVGAIVLLALAIPDLVVFEPDGAPDDPIPGFKASIIQFHQNLFVGPANQVLAGDTLLVDTASQYGVAPIYLLAAWYQLAPIGYGTTGLFDGLLYALAFIAGYGVLRMASVPRALAMCVLAVAVVILIYNLLFPVGGLLQHGMLRFGLPMAIVVAATAAARWPQRRRAAGTLALAALGLSSIWALEAFAYTLFTFAAVAAFDAWTEQEPGRGRVLARRLALGATACVVAHLALAVATLIFAGELPDWGRYLAYLDALLLGELADITYDYSRWSGGLAVGLAYAVSAAGVVLVATRHRALLERERVAFTALAALSAYGIALYSYFVNRSADDILPYVSLPALLAGTLWLAVLLRSALGASREVRAGGLAFALGVGALLVSVAASSLDLRFAHTPLAHLAPGGRSLSSALDRLWSPPPIDPRSPAGETLLDEHWPERERVPILVAPDLGVELLVRAGRAHALPFSDPIEDYFADFPTESEITEAVKALAPGDLLLMQDRGLGLARKLELDPDRDVLTGPVKLTGSEALTPRQKLLLQFLMKRFRLKQIEQDARSFAVVQLAER